MMSNWFVSLFKAKARKKKGPRVVYKNTEKANRPKTKRTRGASSRGNNKSDNRSHQERLDEILDKIKQSGYDSLTDSEKEFLFNASKK